MNERNTIKTWMIIAIVVLFIINLVAITTIFVQNKQNARNNMNFRPFMKEKSYEHFHKFLQNELELSDNEMSEFHNLRKKYMQESRSIMIKMGKKRSQVFEEVIKEEVDTLRLSNLNIEIDKLHVSIRLLTLKHFLEVKKVLSTEQQRKYFRLLNEMSTKFGPPHGQGKRDDCPKSDGFLSEK